LPWYGYLGATLGYVLIMAAFVAWLLPILRVAKRADDLAGRSPADPGGRVVPLRRPGPAVTEHQHTWHMVAHLDGCHLASWSYNCPCGAIRNCGHERDFAAEGGMSMAMWFEESCERCNELADGDPPQEWDEVTERP